MVNAINAMVSVLAIKLILDTIGVQVAHGLQFHVALQVHNALLVPVPLQIAI